MGSLPTPLRARVSRRTSAFSPREHQRKRPVRMATDQLQSTGGGVGRCEVLGADEMQRGLNRGSLDNFRWSVYNNQAQRLFSIDFDNYYWDVSLPA